MSNKLHEERIRIRRWRAGWRVDMPKDPIFTVFESLPEAHDYAMEQLAELRRAELRFAKSAAAFNKRNPDAHAIYGRLITSRYAALLAVITPQKRRARATLT